MAIIDVHSHINILGEKAYSMIDAHDDITTVIINALDIISYDNILLFKEKYAEKGGKKNICVTLGLYPPSELKKDYENNIIESYDGNVEIVIERILQDKHLLSGVGEIGLDGNASNDDFVSDRDVFRKLLNVAQQMKLPAIIHSRKAERQVIEDIRQFKGDIVLHTFSGKKNLAKEALSMRNAYFSIPCILSHSEQFQQLVSMVPLSRLLTETDSPFMPLRGKEYSEPIDIMETIRVIARIKELNEKETAQALFMNAKKVFPHV
jgi:TatD DNase family protein